MKDYSLLDLKIAAETSKTFSEVINKLGMRSRGSVYCKLLKEMIENDISFSHLAKKSKYSKEMLSEAVKLSVSMQDLLRRIEAPLKSFDMVLFEIRRFDIDISHFDGRSQYAGPLKAKKKSLQFVLANEIEMKTCQLKHRLLREKLKEPICEECNRGDHLGLPIPLELNHKDGNKKNNSWGNLELLCSNCHSQTPTFAGKNRKNNLRYSDEELRHAVSQSFSATGTLVMLGAVSPSPIQSRRLLAAINRLRLDINHWSWNNVGKVNVGKNIKPLHELTKYGSKIKSHELKLRLIHDGIKFSCCETCGISDWNGKELSFSLDHINGDKRDNSIENLRILCFICHARTPNYKGKNIPKEKRGISVAYSKARSAKNGDNQEPMEPMIGHPK